MTLAGGAAVAPLLAPLGAHAQPEPMRHIGVLVPLSGSDPEQKIRVDTFRQELAGLGWVDGRNARITYGFGDRGPADFPRLVREMVALKPDVILAQSTSIVSVLKPEAGTIPVVFVNVSDPIGAGYVKSLVRPGGNITGLMLFEAGIAGKWMAMLKEVAPQTARALVIGNPKTTASFDYFLRVIEPVASSFGIEVTHARAEDAADMNRMIDAFAGAPNGGMVVVPDSTNNRLRAQIIALAARHRLPTVYPERHYVEDGGLMFYGVHRLELFRAAAGYVDRILRGANPAEIPVQMPTRYETVVNLKTASALGLTVPPGLLVAADEVIE
jgi:putative ABC transport system substrate-binding protein